MNPLRVTASNYRTFERLDVDLPSGCVAIVGPNGAGKSSLLNAIDVGLFAARGELADLLTVGEDELEIGLDFEHAGELYRVRRQYSARGRGKTTLDFERFIQAELSGAPDASTFAPETWESLTRENTDQTQALIEETIGLSRTTFRASSFLRQGDGAAFTEASPRDRKAILAEILGLAVWDQLQAKARADLRVCEDELVKANALVEQARELAARGGEVREELTAALLDRDRQVAAVEEAERRVDVAQTAHAAAAVTAARIRGLAAEHEAAVDLHDRLTLDLTAATLAEQMLGDVTIELSDLAADAALVAPLEQQAHGALVGAS